MKRDRFVEKRNSDWKEFEKLLAKMKRTRKNKWSSQEIGQLSRIYRSICYDLSLVRSREWGSQLEHYLNNLVAQGNTFIYRAPPRSIWAVVEFLGIGFPKLLRKHYWFFALASALFVGPFVVAALIALIDPTAAESLVSKFQLRQAGEMYSQELYSDVDGQYANQRASMTGFYVMNNIGIAFKCFALGALFGIGTVVILFVNGLTLGTTFGFFAEKGFSGTSTAMADNFFSFVISHGSFELTAIVISGAAGLLLGWGMIHPGNMTRTESIRYHGIDAIKLTAGAGVMLAVAALIEAFFSPLPIDSSIKYVVGVFLWIIVFAYLTLAGRSAKEPEYES